MIRFYNFIVTPIVWAGALFEVFFNGPFQYGRDAAASAMLEVADRDAD